MTEGKPTTELYSDNERFGVVQFAINVQRNIRENNSTPDPYWVHTDSNHHTHEWSKKGRYWVVRTCYKIIHQKICPITDEPVDEVEYRCKSCDETIVPGTILENRSVITGNSISGTIESYEDLDVGMLLEMNTILDCFSGLIEITGFESLQTQLGDCYIYHFKSAGRFKVFSKKLANRMDKERNI